MANNGNIYTGSEHKCTQMRPQIPQSLVRELEREVSDLIVKDKDNNERSMKLYEVGGFNTKGEFVRAAVREKVSKRVEKYNVK